MQVTAIKTPLISPGDQLLPIFIEHLPTPLVEQDVVCVVSKVVAVEQGRVLKLADVQPSEDARRLKVLKRTKDPVKALQLAELILQEADQLFDVEGSLVYLTYKDNLLVANAGIDLSNAPEGCAILWPERPWEWARDFQQGLKAHFGLNDLGVVVTDSHLMPLRRGVTGLAVAYAGFEGVQSEIGKKDLFGRPMELTEKAVADDLASASVFVTGEAGERTPFAVIREAPITFTDREINPDEGFIDPRVDLYAGIYNRRFRYVLSDGGEPGDKGIKA